MSNEKSRRTQLILGVVKSQQNPPKTRAEQNEAVRLLREERPQLFHGVKGGPCTKDGPASIYTPIRNEQDVEDLRNSMACGNYPLSMTDCEVIGINGDCGSRCPVLLRDECEYQDEMLDAYHEGKPCEEKI